MGLIADSRDLSVGIYFLLKGLKSFHVYKIAIQISILKD